MEAAPRGDLDADPGEVSQHLWQQAFRRAKSQLDHDLRLSSQELQRAVADQSERANNGQGDEYTRQQLSKLLRLVGEFLTCSDAAFQASLPCIITWLHNRRKECSKRQACLKSCYSRLLFLLSRCSRLLPSDIEVESSKTALYAAAVYTAAAAGGTTEACQTGLQGKHLRQLLYSDAASSAQPPASSLTAMEPCMEGPADEQLQGNMNASFQHMESGASKRKYRRKSEYVNCCMEEQEDPEQHKLKRSNTMPVQLAEAMQQLLQQAQYAAASGVSAAAAYYPLQPRHSVELENYEQSFWRSQSSHVSAKAVSDATNSSGKKQQRQRKAVFIEMQPSQVDKEGTQSASCLHSRSQSSNKHDTSSLRTSISSNDGANSFADVGDVSTSMHLADVDAVGGFALSGWQHGAAAASTHGSSTQAAPCNIARTTTSSSSGSPTSRWFKQQWKKFSDWGKGLTGNSIIHRSNGSSCHTQCSSLAPEGRFTAAVAAAAAMGTGSSNELPDKCMTRISSSSQASSSSKSSLYTYQLVPRSKAADTGTACVQTSTAAVLTSALYLSTLPVATSPQKAAPLDVQVGSFSLVRRHAGVPGKEGGTVDVSQPSAAVASIPAGQQLQQDDMHCAITMQAEQPPLQSVVCHAILPVAAAAPELAAQGCQPVVLQALPLPKPLCECHQLPALAAQVMAAAAAASGRQMPSLLQGCHSAPNSRPASMDGGLQPYVPPAQASTPRTSSDLSRPQHTITAELVPAAGLSSGTGSPMAASMGSCHSQSCLNMQLFRRMGSSSLLKHAASRLSNSRDGHDASRLLLQQLQQQTAGQVSPASPNFLQPLGPGCFTGSLGLPTGVPPAAGAGAYTARPGTPWFINGACNSPLGIASPISRCQSAAGDKGYEPDRPASSCSSSMCSSHYGAAPLSGRPSFEALASSEQKLRWQHHAMSGCRNSYPADYAAPSPIISNATASLGGGDPGAVALQARTIKCSICGSDVLGIVTLRHNTLCGSLATELSKLHKNATASDARIAVLATWMSEQLAHQVWPAFLSAPVQQIIDIGQMATTLQPNGTSVPQLHCSEAIESLQYIYQQWWGQMHLLTLTESNAEVLAEGAADCDIVVTLSLHMMKQLEVKLRWLVDPRPDRSSLDVSAASTPGRASTVMQVTDFEMICPISRGAYGRVYKVKKKSTGDTFAIKVLTKTDLVRKNMVESVTNERKILALANNPFVVRFYYSFSSPEKLFLVMEYCPGGDLSSLLQNIGRFDEDVARQYIAETVLALEYCHSKGIIHRDVKPDNMLISSTGHIKLSDFGLSKFGGAAAAEGAAVAAAASGAATASPLTSATHPKAAADNAARTVASAGSSSISGSVAPGVEFQFKELVDADAPCAQHGSINGPFNAANTETPNMAECTGMHRGADIRQIPQTQWRYSTADKRSGHSTPDMNTIAHIARLIPHTSLPASPAVFQTPGTQHGPSGVQGASPSASPLPMLQQLGDASHGSAQQQQRPEQLSCWLKHAPHNLKQLAQICSVGNTVGDPTAAASVELASGLLARGVGPQQGVAASNRQNSVRWQQQQQQRMSKHSSEFNAADGQHSGPGVSGIPSNEHNWHVAWLDMNMSKQSQQQPAIVPEGLLAMSAPVDAGQLQQRLQVVSDMQQKIADGKANEQQWQEEHCQALRLGPAAGSAGSKGTCDVTQGDPDAASTGQVGQWLGSTANADGWSTTSSSDGNQATSGALHRRLSIVVPGSQSQQCTPGEPLDNTGSSIAEVARRFQERLHATKHNGAAVAEPVQSGQRLQQQCSDADQQGSWERQQTAYQQVTVQVDGSKNSAAATADCGNDTENHGSQMHFVKEKLRCPSEATHKALGTPDYLAPEMLVGMPYGPEVDWWALGIILYEFVYGAPPFNADTPQEIFERILDCNVEFLTDESGEHVVSEECRDLIAKLLQGNPQKRLGYNSAAELKAHQWFKGIEWDNLTMQKAAFVPADAAKDRATYFVEKPFSKLSIAADLNPIRPLPLKRSNSPAVHASTPCSAPAAPGSVATSSPSARNTGSSGQRSPVGAQQWQPRHSSVSSGSRSWTPVGTPRCGSAPGALNARSPQMLFLNARLGKQPFQEAANTATAAAAGATTGPVSAVCGGGDAASQQGAPIASDSPGAGLPPSELATRKSSQAICSADAASGTIVGDLSPAWRRRSASQVEQYLHPQQQPVLRPQRWSLRQLGSPSVLSPTAQRQQPQQPPGMARCLSSPGGSTAAGNLQKLPSATGTVAATVRFTGGGHTAAGRSKSPTPSVIAPDVSSGGADSRQHAITIPPVQCCEWPQEPPHKQRSKHKDSSPQQRLKHQWAQQRRLHQQAQELQSEQMQPVNAEYQQQEQQQQPLQSLSSMNLQLAVNGPDTRLQDEQQQQPSMCGPAGSTAAFHDMDTAEPDTTCSLARGMAASQPCPPLTISTNRRGISLADASPHKAIKASGRSSSSNSAATSTNPAKPQKSLSLAESSEDATCGSLLAKSPRQQAFQLQPATAAAAADTRSQQQMQFQQHRAARSPRSPSRPRTWRRSAGQFHTAHTAAATTAGLRDFSTDPNADYHHYDNSLSPCRSPRQMISRASSDDTGYAQVSPRILLEQQQQQGQTNGPPAVATAGKIEVMGSCWERMGSLKSAGAAVTQQQLQAEWPGQLDSSGIASAFMDAVGSPLAQREISLAMELLDTAPAAMRLPEGSFQPQQSQHSCYNGADSGPETPRTSPDTQHAFSFGVQKQQRSSARDSGSSFGSLQQQQCEVHSDSRGSLGGTIGPLSPGARLAAAARAAASASWDDAAHEDAAGCSTLNSFHTITVSEHSVGSELLDHEIAQFGSFHPLQTDLLGSSAQGMGWCMSGIQLRSDGLDGAGYSTGSNLEAGDTDAFGDFTTVNVMALQELNREKQQAELLEPLAKVVNEGSAAVTPASVAAVEADPVVAADTAEQQYSVMPLLLHGGIAYVHDEPLFMHQVHGPCAACSNSGCQQHQHRQQTVFSQQQQQRALWFLQHQQQQELFLHPGLQHLQPEQLQQLYGMHGARPDYGAGQYEAQPATEALAATNTQGDIEWVDRYQHGLQILQAPGDVLNTLALGASLPAVPLSVVASAQGNSVPVMHVATTGHQSAHNYSAHCPFGANDAARGDVAFGVAGSDVAASAAMGQAADSGATKAQEQQQWARIKQVQQQHRRQWQLQYWSSFAVAHDGADVKASVVAAGCSQPPSGQFLPHDAWMPPAVAVATVPRYHQQGLQSRRYSCSSHDVHHRHGYESAPAMATAIYGNAATIGSLPQALRRRHSCSNVTLHAGDHFTAWQAGLPGQLPPIPPFCVYNSTTVSFFAGHASEVPGPAVGPGGGLGPFSVLHGVQTPSSNAGTAGGIPAASAGSKRFWAQLEAIATDGSRGYQYRASDNGYGLDSVLQRQPTGSLPGV